MEEGILGVTISDTGIAGELKWWEAELWKWILMVSGASSLVTNACASK